MRRSKLSRHIRRQRRSDEESLYYILERDIDRGAIFYPHDGWFSQVNVGEKGIIDYALKYGDWIVGIEVKKGFPDLKHFDQVARYSKYFDAIFLAYPSDAAAEALFLSESKNTNLQVGILALALYRTHLIRRATVSKRLSDGIWKSIFDESEYWKEWKSFSRDKEDFSLDNDQRLAASALLTNSYWAQVDKKGKPTKDGKIEIPLSAWRFMSVVYALSNATSIYRMHNKTELRDLFFKTMKWGYMNWGDALRTGLIYSREYGNRLALYNLSEDADAFRPEFQKALKKNIGSTDWNKIRKLISELRDKHLAAQHQGFDEFFKK